MPMTVIRAARLALAAALLAAGLPLAAVAQSSYGTLRTPQPMPITGPVEVIEFFWYGVRICYEPEPAIDPAILLNLLPDTPRGR